MKQRFLFVYLLVIAITYSCTSIKVISNKADNYNQKLSNVFVLIQSEAKATKFTNKLSNKLMTAFKNSKIDGRYASKNSLSLETDQEFLNKIKSYNPNQLMIIKQTGISYRTPTIIESIRFKISILEYTSNTVIWKGELEVYGQVGLESSINKSLNKLIQQLKKDSLI